MRGIRILAAAALAVAGAGVAGCNKIDLKAADQASSYRVTTRPSAAIEVPPGFRAVIVAEGLNYPSSIAWDASGKLYALESGTVPIPTLSPKILTAGPEGKLSEVRIEGGFPGPEAVGLAFHDGWLWFSHEQKEDGRWAISRVRPQGGAVETVVRGIPARGDHWINYLAFDRSGVLWFGEGSATNSGVVSSHDPVDMKWLKKRPDARDVPCRDLVLTAQS